MRKHKKLYASPKFRQVRLSAEVSSLPEGLACASPSPGLPWGTTLDVSGALWVRTPQTKTEARKETTKAPGPGPGDDDSDDGGSTSDESEDDPPLDVQPNSDWATLREVARLTKLGRHARRLPPSSKAIGGSSRYYSLPSVVNFRVLPLTGHPSRPF